MYSIDEGGGWGGGGLIDNRSVQRESEHQLGCFFFCSTNFHFIKLPQLVVFFCFSFLCFVFLLALAYIFGIGEKIKSIKSSTTFQSNEFKNKSILIAKI